MPREASLLVCTLLLGCAGSAPSPSGVPEARPGPTAGGAPGTTLPHLTLAMNEASAGFQAVVLGVQEALDAGLPPAPGEGGDRARWEREVRAPWRDDRDLALERLSAHLRRLQAAPSAEQAVAAALVGYLLEDTARADDPIAADRAEALRARALWAYARCLRNGAAAPPELHAWVAFCRARAEALSPAAPSPRQAN